VPPSSCVYYVARPTQDQSCLISDYALVAIHEWAEDFKLNAERRHEFLGRNTQQYFETYFKIPILHKEVPCIPPNGSRFNFKSSLRKCPFRVLEYSRAARTVE